MYKRQGKGIGKEHSDYDIYIIMQDNVIEEYKKKFPFRKYKGLDLIIFSYSEFVKYAYWGGPEEFDRYNFTHLKVLIDKNKEIQKLVDKKARIPEEELSKFISRVLDGYINYLYRSLKCLRDKDIVAARLEAAYSLPLFLDVIFAIHNGRLRPYYKYLRWELENFPLTKLPINTEELIDILMKILDDVDYKSQQKLLNIIEFILRREGYGHIFDSWGADFPWMKNFKLENK